LVAGNIKVGDFGVDGEAEDIGVIGHAFAVISLGPSDLRNGVPDAALNGSGRHAVVVRILVENRWNEESAEELTGQVFAVADADVTAESGHARAIG